MDAKRELLKLAQAAAASVVLTVAAQIQAGSWPTLGSLGQLIVTTAVVRAAGWLVQRYGPAPA